MQERVEVESMMRAGEPLDRIQHRIEDMPVGEEARSALWLLAWCERGRGTRRRSAYATDRPLSVVGDDRAQRR